MSVTKSITLVMLMMISLFQSPKKITVYLIGDSTMSNKKTEAYPETGWGMPFKYFFDSTVVVDNRAKNGRSTRTFISENLWQPVADNLKEGDYVFIQFGHNDESKEKGDRYTTAEQYKSNLVKFITETRAKKANPILLTPVSRRKFKDGKVQETHQEYSPLVIEVATQQHVPLIDLDTKSRELLQKFGEEQSKLLFLQLAPGEHPNYPEGKNDNTHFNELGARLIAQIVLDEIKNQKIGLADRMAKPIVKK
jgi:lysophospholipase L1-like esterase